MVKLMVDLRAWAIVIAVAALIVGLAKHGDGCACRLQIPVLKKRELIFVPPFLVKLLFVPPFYYVIQFLNII